MAWAIWFFVAIVLPREICVMLLLTPMYNSVLVTKLVNSIMLDGKKGVAQKVVYGAFDIIKDKTENCLLYTSRCV